MKLDRRIQFALILLAMTLVASAADPVRAQLYEFISLADTTLPAPTGMFTSFADDPSVHSGAAFVGNYPGGSGVFTRYLYGGVQTLAKTGDAAPSGVFTAFGPTASLDSTVTYHASYASAQSGIFQQIGNGPRVTIAKTGDPAPSGVFTGFGKPAMANLATSFLPSNQNMAAFRADFGGTSGIFTGTGGAPTLLVKVGDPTPWGGTFQSFGNPALSSVRSPMGTSVPGVAFVATYDLGEALFLAANGAITPITQAPFFPTDGDPSLLHDRVAFKAFGNIYMSTLDGSNATEMAAVGQPAPTGAFSSFGDPFLTFFGVGFEGTYGGGNTGIFGKYGFSSGPSHSIVKSGDSLFGSQVVTVNLVREGGRSSRWGLEATGVGDFAFHYVLADGRQGIAVAVATPEPAATSLTACAALAGLQMRRRKRTASAVR